MAQQIQLYAFLEQLNQDVNTLKTYKHMNDAMPEDSRTRTMQERFNEAFPKWARNSE